MVASLRKLAQLLTRRDRRNAGILLLLMVLAAVLEVVGVSAIPAFVSGVIHPDKLVAYPLVHDTLQALRLTDPAEFVVFGACILILVFAVKNGFLVFNAYLQMRFVANRRIDLAQRLITAYLRAPLTFHLARNTSQILRNVEKETGILAYEVLGAILEVCTRSFILLAVFLLLLVIEPWITLGSILIFGLPVLLGAGAVGARLKRYGLQEQEERQFVVQAINEGLGSLKEARVLNRQPYFAARVGESIRRMSTVIRFKQFASRAIPPLTELIAVTGLLGIAVVLVLLNRSTESILVTLSLFAVGLVRLRETLGAMVTHFANLRYNIVSVDPVYADLELLEASARRPGRDWEHAAAPLQLKKHIELEHVWYRYQPSELHALQGVSLVIPAGAAVGLVGATGAGKSTVVDVILGLLEPDAGSVMVDGVDIRGRGVAAWQRAIGYVPQSIYLIDDTLRRNIALGLSDAEIDEMAVRSAVRMAQLESFVTRQPAGLDAMIGERGVRLSGGERQRIGIARALYHDPVVLIMDEATGALDNTTERAIIGAVEALKGKRTVIMVAHRLTTVINCDALFFMKDGRIEAVGSYVELQARHRDFRRMASAQALGPS